LLGMVLNKHVKTMVGRWNNWSTSGKSRDAQIWFPWHLDGRKLFLLSANFQFLCTPQWLRQRRWQHENWMACLSNGGQKRMWLLLLLFDACCWLQL
jgi:hypothetical protein